MLQVLVQLRLSVQRLGSLVQQNTSVFLGLLWFVWLFAGTIFYAVECNLGWARGFYMSVNVGYSIGWGFPVEPNHRTLWYSIFHVLVGSSAVAAALSFFATAMLEENKHWYERAQKLAKRQAMLNSARWKHRMFARYEVMTDGLFPFFCWVVWIFMGTMWSCLVFHWPVSEGLYFAVSTCSTGGLWAIPRGSSEATYCCVGLYAAFGVPLAGLAMATLATKLLQGQNARVEEVEAMLEAPVTQKELDMMRRFGLEDGDGEVDKGEFVILCMARMGAVDPTIVKMITTRFMLLDTSGDGQLSYEELMGTAGMSLAAGSAAGDAARADAQHAASLSLSALDRAHTPEVSDKAIILQDMRRSSDDTRGAGTGTEVELSSNAV